jgi:hypothetical protein
LKGGPDFREEFNFNERGPVRVLQRPQSNKSLYIPPPQAEIQLPPSLSNERMMRFNSSVDGKALLHDLDNKFEQ